VKHFLAVVTCGAVMVVSLAACASTDEKFGLPTHTGVPSPSTTATSQPTKASPTGTSAASDPLAAHATYQYGDLLVVLDFPADISRSGQPSARVFSEFLQARSRTTANNKLDPALAGLASADVVNYVQGTIDAQSVRGIGSVTYTATTVRSGKSGLTMITGCLDQSKLVQVHQDGSHFPDAAAKDHPTMKMTAVVSPSYRGLEVSTFTFDIGTCDDQEGITAQPAPVV